MLKPTGTWNWTATDFPEDAVGLRFARILPGERLRLYEGVRWESGRAGMAQFLRQTLLSKEAFANDDYAIADVLDADHNVIEEFGIADAETFRRLQYRLRCRVESTDGDGRLPG